MARFLLRAEDRIAKPRKNGGGITTDVAMFPPEATLDDFQWRISIAQITGASTFSQFPEIDRKLAVLDGHMTLIIADREAVTLSSTEAPLEFPGEALARAVLGNSPVTDLNVMTRRNLFQSRMTRYKGAETFELTLQSDVAPIFAIHDLTVTFDGNAYVLTKLDGLLIQNELGHKGTVQSPQLDFYFVEVLRT